MYTVIKYGIPTLRWEAPPQMAEQNYLRQKYWNSLVEIEKWYWEQRDDLISKMAPGLATFEETAKQAKEALEQLQEQSREHKKRERTRKVPKFLSEAITDARAKLKEARAQLKTERSKIYEDDDVLAMLSELDRQRQDRVNHARGESGLYWGNYMPVEGFYKQARRKKGRQLKFHRPTQDTGTVSVHFHGGMDTGRILGIGNIDSRLSIAAEWPVKPEKVKRPWLMGRLRLGTNEDKSPIYVDFPLVVHRALPRGLVKQASLVWQTIAGRRRYELILCIDTPDYPVKRENTGPARPEVGIDVGWRIFPDRLRVAVMAWADGRTDEIAIPRDTVEVWRKVEDLKSLQGNHFNECKGILMAEIDRLGQSQALPEWAQEMRTALSHMKSHRRLVRYVEHWYSNRFQGDDALFLTADSWRKRHQHLWQWESHQRDQLRGWRRDLYRRWAHAIATKAQAVIVEQFNIAQVAENPETETAANFYRGIASVSEFRSILAHTCAREGVEVRAVDGAWTTQTCWACGGKVQFDSKMEVRAECPHCGQEWDQDVNAAKNLLHWPPEPDRPFLARADSA